MSCHFSKDATASGKLTIKILLTKKPLKGSKYYLQTNKVIFVYLLKLNNENCLIIRKKYVSKTFENSKPIFEFEFQAI